ncbi:MAG: hypothetical protein J3R72DRAFT_371330 [Linnemannia gamsii]|nr:MAG: hypothetical protein J3R72DRAFT_371330 [Linnemannia gamsii]
MVLNGSYDTPVIVGRGSQATLNLGRINKQVSRRHAIIQWCSESSTFEITVLGQNGVRINGAAFPSGQQATLRAGDIVDLVGVKMLFRAPATPPPAASEQLDYQDGDSSSQDVYHEEDQIFGDSDTITKSTTSTTTVKASKAKSAPKEKAVKEAPAVVQKDTTSSREPSPDAGVNTKSSASSDKEPRDYTEMIIDTLVFARKKKSMTLTELFDEMITSQPSLMATHDAEEIKEQMLECLTAARCVGKITRKGKDAYNKPLENQWYYIPECDHNVMRKLTRQEVMPSARKCTLKDKQYFFKMPPKLPYHRKSTSPYAVKPSARRAKEPSKLSTADNDDGSNGDVSSSSSSSDLEDDVDAQPLSTLLNRKRKSTVSGHVDKKRKASTVVAAATTTATGSKHDDEEEDEDEDEDDAHNDSLDDLSELSGLSD